VDEVVRDAGMIRVLRELLLEDPAALRYAAYVWSDAVCVPARYSA
jgi:hypothetical protein